MQEIEIKSPRRTNQKGNMDKVNSLFPQFPVEQTGPNHAFSKTHSNFQIDDQRVARLLVLLKQLDESAGGLEALPEPELSEIVWGAIRVCGFVDPIEAREVIAVVLDAIEIQNPFPERAASEGPRIALSDA
jgi:hypothetical protein